MTDTIKDIINQCTGKFLDMTAFRYPAGNEIVEKKYSELKADSMAVSRALKSLGLEKKHIAIIGMSSYEWIISYLGVVNSASVAVPLDASLPAADLHELLNRADVSALICDKTQVKTIEKLKENCPNITHLITMREGLGGDYVLSDLIEKNRGEYDTEIDPDALCTLMYTSGTTGKSKGVMLSHKNLASNVENCYVEIAPGVVSMSVLPIHHAYCLTSGVLKSLSLGSCICINDSMMHFAKNFKTFCPEVTLLVPLIIETLYQKLRDADPAIPKKMVANEVFGPNLKIIFSGGAYLNPDLVDFFEEYGISVLQGYGMTECSPVISNNNQLHSRNGSIGKPLANCEVKFVDEEICIKGSSVMMGYYKMPEETAQTLDGDGWLHTGDLGRMDNDGFLYITGRKKNLIILSNGENISPEELENELGKNDLVKEVLVRENGTNIEAEIFPDEEYAKKNGITDIRGELQDILDVFNKSVPIYKRITALKVRDTEFDKNATQKIKRF